MATTQLSMMERRTQSIGVLLPTVAVQTWFFLIGMLPTTISITQMPAQKIFIIGRRLTPSM
jgi:hypothetical protein